MPTCGWSILERPPFFLMGRHWITGSPGKKATGRMGTCWDWTIWLASWKASLKDELRKAQNLQGFSVTFCFTEVEGDSVRRKPLTPNSWGCQCRGSCIQNPAVSDQSYFASALYEPKWITPDWLYCTRLTWDWSSENEDLHTRESHQHESRGLCGKPEWLWFLAKWDSRLFLREPGQILGNSGQEKWFFRELRSFETRLWFFPL